MSIIRTENLTHVYSSGTPFERTAVDNITFSADEGEFLGIIGHTGSGKSTFIQHLNGLLKPTSGKVFVDGEDIHQSGEKTRAARFKVGLVFQYPEYQLFEETVYKDIAFGPKNMKLSEDEIDRRVKMAAEITGLDEEILSKSPFDLSGGQKRRVAIAGVFAMTPRVLILDEPAAGLDPRGRETIIGNIRAYHEKTGACIIMVTHSMEDVAKYADRLLVLDHGRAAMQGTPEEVFSQADKLEEMGLTVPDVTKVALALRRYGIDLGPVYTTAQAVEAILKLKGGRRDA